MSRFAEYTPVRPRRAAGNVSCAVDIEEARPGDIEAIHALSVDRDGSDPERTRKTLESQLAASEQACRLFVARWQGDVVGFGRVSRFEVSPIPAGWYLSGLIVSPDRRRLGIGRAMTEYRIRWLVPRTDVAYYFVNSDNRASIDLHAEFGFREIDRGITVPGCAFEGAPGVLYVLSLATGARDTL